MKCSVLLPLVACIWVTSVQSQEVEKCSPTNGKTMKFSVTSQLNQTGHLSYQVDYQHEKKEGLRPWTVEVEQRKLDCSGVEHFLTTTKIIVAPQTPADYELHAGVGFYKLHTVKKTWGDAKQTCAEEGGHLAIVNSEAEMAVLFKIFAKYPAVGDWTFLGFHDLYTEGNFVTIFEQPLNETGFSRWLVGEPNNNEGKEHCGSIIVKYPGVLNDFQCHVPSPFFCEIEL